jgi:hypothetical protein
MVSFELRQNTAGVIWLSRLFAEVFIGQYGQRHPGNQRGWRQHCSLNFAHLNCGNDL